MNTINLTDFEKLMLRMIAENFFQSTGTHLDWVWSMNLADCHVKGLNPKSFSGVCSSLCKKGLAETDGNVGRDACIRLTPAGVEAWKGFAK